MADAGGVELLADLLADAGAELPADTGADVQPPEETVDAPPADVPFVYPDPAFFHKEDSPELAKASHPYLMDERTMYRTVETLPSLDVRCLSAAGGETWAGTADGVYRFDEDTGKFEAAYIPAGVSEPVVDIARTLDEDGTLIFATATRVGYHNTGSQQTDFVYSPGPALTAVELGAAEIFVGTAAGGLFALEKGSLDPGFAEVGGGQLQGMEIRGLAEDAEGVLWLATDAGLHSWDGDVLASHPISDDDVRSVLAAPDGAVLAGAATGIARIEAGDVQIVEPGVGSIPYHDVRGLALGGGRLVLAHGIGASALEEPFAGGKAFARLDHYTSQRWLPHNQVNAAAVDDQGRIWLGTPAGISRIEWVSRTLAEKAQHMEELQDEHFWRMDGFVPSDAWTDDPWEPTSWFVSDKDNDGLWTQMQIGAWCYAYAATGDEYYYDKARKATDVMYLQVDIPAISFAEEGKQTGFITRSLVRDDEGGVYDNKIPQENWHLVNYEGHDYYWKDDTSSDEYAGHFYGYPLFYDLCAKTDEERQELADRVWLAASYLVDNDYKLIDLDGVKTGHGHWYPERIGAAADGMDACIEAADEAENKVEAVSFCIGSWHGEGWLNSIEILGHLLGAWHITGDQKFFDAYEELVTVHKYDQVAMPHEDTYTITNPSFMNHSDHELAMMAYNTLIRYEPDDDRRQIWIDSLLFLYEWEKVERNPLWTAYVALLAGFEHTEMEPALQSLREMPFDQRIFEMDNSHRMDAADWPDDRFDDPQFATVFPYDEIRTVWWNGNLHVKYDGGNGTGVQGPMAWLLPYWAMRYAGVIGE